MMTTKKKKTCSQLYHELVRVRLYANAHAHGNESRRKSVRAELWPAPVFLRKAKMAMSPREMRPNHPGSLLL